jgi:hypothetical protein
LLSELRIYFAKHVEKQAIPALDASTDQQLALDVLIVLEYHLVAQDY